LQLKVLETIPDFMFWLPLPLLLLTSLEPHLLLTPTSSPPEPPSGPLAVLVTLVALVITALGPKRCLMWLRSRVLNPAAANWSNSIKIKEWVEGDEQRYSVNAWGREHSSAALTISMRTC
jgi:hypothetical protein